MTIHENGLYIGHHHPDVQSQPQVTSTDDEITPQRGPPAGIPTEWLPSHTFIAGATGSGKSILTQQLLMSAHESLEGTRIVFDGKGDGLPHALARGIYTRQGHLDDVLYFPCAEILPAISVFDIRPAREAGVPHELAVSNVIDLYLELLSRLTDTESQAGIRSFPILRAALEALFDPVHGSPQFDHQTLYEAIDSARAEEAVPASTNEHVAEVLQTLQSESDDVREGTLTGVLSLLMQFQTETGIRTLFDHTPARIDTPPLPTDDAAPELHQGTRFDFQHLLDRDVTIIFDLSGYGDRTQRLLTQLLTSRLWFALKRRTPPGDAPQNLLAIDEFANLAPDNHFAKLLSAGRGLNLSVTTVMQFPQQVREALKKTGNTRLYKELLTESEQFIIGPLLTREGPLGRLADQFQTEADIADRLSRLPKGEWLCQFTPNYGEPPTETFTLESPRLPPGYPDGPQPLTGREQAEFEDELDACRETTRRRFGITAEQTTTETENATTQAEDTDADTTHPTSSATAGTTIPFTTQLPEPVTYEPPRHAFVCDTCENAYPVNWTGLVRAIGCHSSLTAVDRSRTPPVECQLTLTPNEITNAPVTRPQLRFLQLVWNVQRRLYHPVAFDLVTDSMTDLRAYAGVDADDVTALQEAGLLKIDEPFRRSLYSVTTAGWQQLNASPREGLDFGHGCGDQEETTTHVAMVEALTRYIRQEYVEDPESPVTTVVRYYKPHTGTPMEPVTPTANHRLPPGVTYGSGATNTEKTTFGPDTNVTDTAPVQTRVDVAGLTADGAIHVVGEAERHNNDNYESVPRDFDKMAALDPEAALWVAPSRSRLTAGVIDPLQEPTDGESRLTNEYSENTATQERAYDAPGLTDVFTHSDLAKEVGIDW